MHENAAKDKYEQFQLQRYFINIQQLPATSVATVEIDFLAKQSTSSLYVSSESPVSYKDTMLVLNQILTLWFCCKLLETQLDGKLQLV